MLNTSVPRAELKLQNPNPRRLAKRSERAQIIGRRISQRAQPSHKCPNESAHHILHALTQQKKRRCFKLTRAPKKARKIFEQARACFLSMRNGAPISCVLCLIKRLVMNLKKKTASLPCCLRLPSFERCASGRLYNPHIVRKVLASTARWSGLFGTCVDFK